MAWIPAAVTRTTSSDPTTCGLKASLLEASFITLRAAPPGQSATTKPWPQNQRCSPGPRPFPNSAKKYVVLLNSSTVGSLLERACLCSCIRGHSLYQKKRHTFSALSLARAIRRERSIALVLPRPRFTWMRRMASLSSLGSAFHSLSRVASRLRYRSSLPSGSSSSPASWP